MDIIASVGPASESEEVLTALSDAGATIFRFNSSHQGHDVHLAYAERVRRAAPNARIMIDIQGIKFRIGNYVRLRIEAGMDLVLDGSLQDKAPEKIEKGEVRLYKGDPIPVPPLFVDSAKEGDLLYVGDGELMLRIEKKDGLQLHCQTIDGGVIGIHKAVTVQGAKIDSGAFTEKDLDDLAFCAELQPEYIALSFVQSEADVKQARELLADENPDYKPVLISKIETVKGVENLDSIVKASDGVMVARGDLALHIDFAELGIVEKRILDCAKKHKKFSVVATGMIESLMHGNKVPSRAEIIDLTVAKEWGASAVMVSSETTMGDQPVYSIEVMKRVLDVA